MSNNKLHGMNDEAFEIVVGAAQAVTALNKDIGSSALENLTTGIYEAIARCIDESECEECDSDECNNCSNGTQDCTGCDTDMSCECCGEFDELHERIDELEEEIANLKQIIIELHSPSPIQNIVITLPEPVRKSEPEIIRWVIQ